jgi:hypothetical protein
MCINICKLIITIYAPLRIRNIHKKMKRKNIHAPLRRPWSNFSKKYFVKSRKQQATTPEAFIPLIKACITSNSFY